MKPVIGNQPLGLFYIGAGGEMKGKIRARIETESCPEARLLVPHYSISKERKQAEGLQRPQVNNSRGASRTCMY